MENLDFFFFLQNGEGDRTDSSQRESVVLQGYLSGTTFLKFTYRFSRNIFSSDSSNRKCKNSFTK